MADRTGNIYIADKEAHAIRKVTLDGNIHTVAGNNLPGYGDTNPVPATSVSLFNPNGLWVFPDDKFYILDRDNGLIRKVDTNGIMTLVVDHGAPIPEGRGLWVSPDESILYYSASTQVMRWDTTNGLSVFASGFFQLGNLAVDPVGRLYVTDRGANQAYRLDSEGATTLIAGNGSAGGGGDGYLAVETGLWQLRGIWFLPTGAFFLATDNGSQVWYVDTAGVIHLFLNGDFSSHNGDGAWFYDPATPKVSKVRQITMDYDGNLIITENDAGFIRKVQFLRHQP
jgi:sugar lactone lactonase YvrE